MKTGKLIVTFVILGLIALGGGYMLGLFSKSGSSIVEEVSTAVEKETDSETVADTVSEPDVETVVEEEEEAGHEEGESPIYHTEAGLVAYYPFDGNSKDYSGEENDGTNYDAIFVGGKKGQALSFNGKDTYVHSPININPIPMPQMTMTAWVKAEDDTKIRKVVCQDNSGYDRCMGIDNRGGEGWSCFAGDGKILGYNPVTVDEWTFVAAVYDQTAGTVKLFVDGATYEKKGKIVGGGNDFILIGANGSTKLQREYFMGVIDEVRIYDYALSNKELNSLYKTGVARPETE